MPGFGRYFAVTWKICIFVPVKSNDMKHILNIIISILLFLLATIRVSAQTQSIVEKLDSTPGVTIVQPDELKARLAKITATSADEVQSSTTTTPAYTRTAYYRVEVFSDNSRNAKNLAMAKRRNMQTRFPQYPSSLSFDSPFWRVHVGEFRSRSDAESAMAEIRQAFPSYAAYLRIVRQ